MNKSLTIEDLVAHYHAQLVAEGRRPMARLIADRIALRIGQAVSLYRVRRVMADQAAQMIAEPKPKPTESQRSAGESDAALTDRIDAVRASLTIATAIKALRRRGWDCTEVRRSQNKRASTVYRIHRPGALIGRDATEAQVINVAAIVVSQ